MFFFIAYLEHPPATHECPQKMSAQSVQLFGRLYATYVLFYYIDYENKINNTKIE